MTAIAYDGQEPSIFRIRLPMAHAGCQLRGTRTSVVRRFWAALRTSQWLRVYTIISASEIGVGAEVQIGNMVGAENYYQHAEHYFTLMSSDRRGT